MAMTQQLRDRYWGGMRQRMQADPRFTPGMLDRNTLLRAIAALRRQRYGDYMTGGGAGMTSAEKFRNFGVHASDYANLADELGIPWKDDLYGARRGGQSPSAFAGEDYAFQDPTLEGVGPEAGAGVPPIGATPGSSGYLPEDMYAEDGGPEVLGEIGGEDFDEAYSSALDPIPPPPWLTGGRRPQGWRGASERGPRSPRGVR